MKYYIISLALLFMTPFVYKQAKTETVSITVTVEDIRSNSGSVGIALYEEGADFPDGEPLKAESISLRGSGSVEYTFEDVPAGDYAVAVMHDENDNGDMDFNEYGMPMEGFGFSNEAMGDMGPPDFDMAAFTADEDTDISVSLIYMGGW